MKHLKFKNYPIFKKRDGQSYKEVSYIYAPGFIEAKKQFAKNCAKDLRGECWLTYFDSSEFDKKGNESGFYLNENIVFNENETINCELSVIDCFLSQKQINKGFTLFSEDVYTWELRLK